MTDEERALLRLVNQRVARMQPDMARAWRRYFELLSQEMGTQRVVDLLAAQRYDELLSDEVFARISSPLREQFQDSLKEGFRLTLPDIPGAVVGRTPQIFFDVLNARVKRTIETLESRTLDTLRESARQVVRDTVSDGLQKGLHPNAISRDLREVIGLSRQQAGYIRNASDDLLNFDPRYFERERRDKRYDASVRRSFAEGKPLPLAERQKITDAYARKYTKYNAELNTRAATLDSYRLSQWESYASSIDRGIIDGDEAEKVWIHFDQKNPRPDHLAWNGTIVGFYEPFPDGQQQAGLNYYNCRCSTLYRVRRRHVYPQPLAA